LVRPLRPTAGQASAEYVALLALLAAVLAGAGLLVAPPALGARISGALRTAICIVGGDVCRASDARAEGLAPCPVREDTRGSGGGVSVAFLELDGDDELSVTRRSDGSVLVAIAGHRTAGVGAGIGAEVSPLGAHLVADGSAGARFAEGDGWELPDLASAARFVHALRAGEPPPEPTWTYREAGETAQGVAGAGTSRAGVLASLGRRTGRGTTTWYVVGELDVDVLGGLAVPAADSASRRVLIEHTSDASGPRELLFRVARPLGPGRVEEVTGRLDLHDPVNRAVAERLMRPRLPVGPAVRRDIRAVVQRVVEDGTVEQAVFSVLEEERGLDVTAGLGMKLGVRVRRLRRTRRLTAASVWSRAAGARRRVDCVGGRA
jgi:hypothetical protein